MMNRSRKKYHFSYPLVESVSLEKHVCRSLPYMNFVCGALPYGSCAEECNACFETSRSWRTA